MIRTQINLKEDQYKILLLESKRQKRSLSELVREMIETCFIKQKKGNAGVLLKMADKAGISGEPNLSLNYKELLFKKDI
ncbi:hypothetical protein COY34_03395 [candidate division WWE3 bacterium CG_4_10_14_0_2_um_filter_42_8]|nr:MAG: hypothetical protein COY34_03395 [candidate division WWE3 bacterium CG_4_10_14_0_2_um_filter_42_8]